MFNMWYLAYFDEAMSLYLKEGGLPYQKLLDSGHDVQLAHTEIDWRVPLRWPDEAAIVVSLESRGNTSFILRFEVYHDDVLVCRARTVYVVVATDGTGVKAIPEVLDTALQ